jgi:hypothetical protein
VTGTEKFLNLVGGGSNSKPGLQVLIGLPDKSGDIKVLDFAIKYDIS